MDPFCWTMALHDAAPQLCSSRALKLWSQWNRIIHAMSAPLRNTGIGNFLGDRNIAVWFKSPLTSVTSEKSGSKSHWCAQSNPGRHLFRCAPVGTLESFCPFPSSRYCTEPNGHHDLRRQRIWPVRNWWMAHLLRFYPLLSASQNVISWVRYALWPSKNLSKWTSPTHLTKKHGVLVVFEGEASEEWIEGRSFHTCEMRGATTARDGISITTSSEKLRLLLSPIPVLGPLLPELFFLACCGARNLLRKGERAGNFCGVCCPILSF